ncbi:MAG: hypothetical protein UU82_C0017G0003 [Candidatus Nomurabacteria bacterium GW2011_GWC2_41_8]|uniref:Uncharacterized protein n=1 Tax=Candidatus Nomurabacteria bacterium GW2011_GWC2_41_8 TaxID=1618755 RepID=A0A0G0XG81_9BACT|nr:MAG: hypothetical protein UU82_C0017G0003 [Candidatus Nomurabacteria bacterium GW2011_GWC2_41_8]
MKKNTLSILILISGILISGAIIGSANAQTDSRTVPEISFPVVELGNCADKASCKAYCDKTENIEACLSFAEKNNLMQKEEIDAAKKFKDIGMAGPGGCKGKNKCDTYCSDLAHIDECITFAEKNGLMSGEELDEAKKVQVAIAKGIKPPACGGKEACDAYCSSSEHMEECLNFSIEAGIMDPQKQEESKKVLAAIKQGIKPPACKGKDACDEYCGVHMEECMTFSLAAGMVPDDQKEQMQKTLNAFKQGIKPPACRPNPPDQSNQPDQPKQPSQQNQNQPTGQANQPGEGLQACDQYCADPGHVEECVKFSVAIGNMTEEQAQNSIKNGGKGPGGCIGRDACGTFCDNPDNQETCFNFGKDNGMIPEADLQKMQNGQQRMKDSFSQIPQEVLDCITSSSGADIVEKMKTGSVIGRKFGDSINQCFQKSGAQERPPGQDLPGQEQPNQNQQGQSGDNFQPGPGTINPGGQRMPQQAGPGGCKGPEECQKYCISNPEVCKNFQPQQNQPGQMQPGQFIQIQPGEPGQMQPGQFIQGQFDQSGQMQPQQQLQPQPIEQQNLPPPPPPSSFLQGTQGFLANALNALKGW